MNNSKQNWIIYAISIVLVLAISIQTIEFINTPKREIPALIAEGWTHQVCSPTGLCKEKKEHW